MERRCIFLVIVVFHCLLAIGAARSNDQVTLKEESNAGVVVARIEDYWPPSEQTCPECGYTIVKTYIDMKGEQRMVTQAFTINSNSGTVTTLRPIDREEECPKTCNCKIKIMIGKSVGDSVNYKAMRVLVINLLDMNDNKPVFKKNLKAINVSESREVGTPISINEYLARDYDCRSNALLNYTLEENDHFVLADMLEDSKYRLMHRTHLSLRIKSRLDHENQSIYRLRLTAHDNGNPPRSEHVTLLIHVQDANDNAPIFGSEEYALSVREDLHPGKIITTVHAHDIDRGVLNGMVRYRLLRQQDPFPKQSQSSFPDLVTVDAVTGEVTLNEQLYWQDHNGVSFVIEASDQGKNKKNTATTTLILNIEDVNDNAPELNVDFIITPDENNPNIGYISESHHLSDFVAYIRTSDKDNGKNAQTTLTIQEKDNDENNPYFECQDNEMLVLIRKLDRESRSEHDITITACDRGREPRCTSQDFTIRVLDENEYAPEFIRSDYSTVVREDTKIGTRLLILQATDADSENPPVHWANKNTGKIESSRNGVVSYHMGEESGKYFAIDRSTGELFLTKKLDYEQKKKWLLNVTASDGGQPTSLSSWTTVEITVSDVNDNRPVFVLPKKNNQSAHASMLEDTVIYEIKTQDKDSDASMPRIELISVDGETRLNRFFRLDDDGKLRIDRSRPDLDEVEGNHELVFRATDSDDQSFWSEIMLNVEVWNTYLPDDKKYNSSTQGGGSTTQTGHNSNIYTSTTTEHSTLFTILIITLVAILIFIFLLVACIVMRRKNKQQETHTYSCRDAEKKGVYQQSSSNPEDGSHSNRPSTASRQATISVSGSIKEVPKKMRGDDSDVTSESLLSSRGEAVVASVDLSCKPPMLSCKYSKDEKNFNIPTAGGRRGLTPSSNIDIDSGRGDSDPDAANYDIFNGFVYNPTASLPRDQHRDVDNMTSKCTKECALFGHSDSCWMPQQVDMHKQQQQQGDNNVFYPSVEYNTHPLETIQEVSPYDMAPSSGVGGMKTVSHPHSIDPRRNYYFAPLPSTADPHQHQRGYQSLNRSQRDDSESPSPPPSSGNTSRHSITSCASSSRSNQQQQQRRSPAERYLSLAKNGDYSRTTPLLSSSSASSAVARCDDETAALVSSMSMRETQKIVKDIDKLLAQNV